MGTETNATISFAPFGVETETETYTVILTSNWKTKHTDATFEGLTKEKMFNVVELATEQNYQTIIIKDEE